MEAFSLLKFWKSSSSSAANTILAAVDDDGAVDPPAAGDDGPFFDLEFAAPDSDDDEEGENSVAELVCVEEAEEGERSDPDLPVSPSGEVFFSGEVLAVGPDSGHGKAQLFPVALVRSATRLRVLMAGLKRHPRPSQARPDPTAGRKKKLFTVKFKAGEVPIVSLFTRDHSARPLNGAVSSLSSSSSTSSSATEADGSEHQSPAPDPVDEKRNPKDRVQKYFKMVKPLYIRVSKRYGEKLGLGSGSPVVESPPATAVEDKATENQEPAKETALKTQGSLGVGLKVMMRKRLSGKSKSAEAGVVHPAAPPPAGGRQRDDSLNQQQEWIQGAILHCKRSFNASRDDESESESASVLSRSASDPSHEKTSKTTSEEDDSNSIIRNQFPRECAAEIQ